MAFIGLHNHTHYSNFRLRDSISKVDSLIEYAHELGHKGIALTEHECITSSLDAVKFYYSHKDDPGWNDFKILCGNEIYLCPEHVNAENKEGNVFPHFLLIALNAKGHEQIRELSTRAWDHAFKQVMTRVPTYYNDLVEIIQPDQGNVVGSSACLGGSLPTQLLKYRQPDNSVPADVWQQCIDWIDFMTDIFGKGFFFLELQPSNNEEQIYVNQKLIQLSEETDTPYIITTDSHYTKKEDKEAHKIYLSSQDGEREVDAFYETTYVMSEAEIHEYMDQYIGHEAVETGFNNTMRIYHMAEMYDLRKELRIPYIPFNKEEPDVTLYQKYKDKIPHLSFFYDTEVESDRHMLRDLLIGIDQDPYYQTPEAFESIDTCLKSIVDSSEKQHVHWSAYLLQIAEYVKIAWEAGTLVGPGRGSGVGFCILNILGITQINPLRETTQTYHWRFLNPERASVLDIDIDIEGAMRDTVIEALKEKYGQDRVSKVLTLSTEKSKSAILTAARGLGIDTDIAQYIASLIVADRGTSRNLQVMYYGDPDNDISPVWEFRNEMKNYPELWEMAQKFEGLICGVGSHAGGVIIVDEPFTKTTALMRTNSGDIVTQFDLHGCEEVSLIKVDLLSIESLDKIYVELNLLLKDHQIEWQGSLEDTYEKYLGVYTLDRTNKEMWKMLWDHKVLSFFQMEKESGIQAVALAKPESVDDLATINSVMRLMAQEKGGETPLHKYARFKNDITEWYKEMDEAGLTLEEQEILKEILGVSCGICEAQEYLILLVTHPKIGGFSLGWGDKLRKAVAKKQPKMFIELEKEFFQNAEEKGLSKNLVNYVWHVLISTQRGYGFNKSHTLAYSIIGLQELNLAYHYPIIYWNTANLIVDSGSLEENDSESTDYGKIATAMAKMKEEGVNIALPLINSADFSFVPDVKNNRIIYSLKALCGLGKEDAYDIISKRQYTSFESFMEVTSLKNKAIITLIKAGAFTELDNPDPRQTMMKYLKNYIFKPCEQLTFQQYGQLEKLQMIPDHLHLASRIYHFRSYVLDDYFLYQTIIDSSKKVPKKGYHDRYFKLDQRSMEFFTENFDEDSCVVGVDQTSYVISEKAFLKVWKEKIKPLEEWFKKESTLQEYNRRKFEICWDSNATGTREKWEMDALCFYYTKHELADLDTEYYSVEDFYSLPEEPEAYDYYTRYINGEKKQIPKNRIARIAGTVIDKNNDKHVVTLLTTTGVVNVKIGKGQYSFYNRRISKDGTVIDDSWFKRGTKIFVCGYRRESQFFAYRYADTVYQHTIMKIDSVDSTGRAEIITERERVDG